MIKHRWPWLEAWGPGGKLETAGRFCPPNLSALWETQPRNQPAPHHGAGKRHRQGHRGAEMAESSERHSSVCEKERQRSFQSSAGWNPLALLPLGAPGGAECTCAQITCVCPHSHARTPIHGCPRRTHTHTRSHEYVRARPWKHTCNHVPARIYTHAHTDTGPHPQSARALFGGSLGPCPGPSAVINVDAVMGVLSTAGGCSKPVESSIRSPGSWSLGKAVPRCQKTLAAGEQKLQSTGQLLCFSELRRMTAAMRPCPQVPKSSCKPALPRGSRTPAPTETSCQPLPTSHCSFRHLLC